MAVEFGACVTKSLTPRIITYMYGAASGLTLIVISIIAAMEAENVTWSHFKSSPWKCIKILFHSTRKKKSCYFPIVSHIFDQITDVAVICEFYVLSTFESKYNTNRFDYCGGVNTLYLFIASIVCLLCYRTISSVIIYQNTNHDIFRVVTQFLFECELFRCIYTNYICHSVEPSNPQRLLQSLEAIFEATPQTMIQLFFIIKTAYYHGNKSSGTVYVVVISVIFSVLSVVNRAIMEDRAVIKDTEAEQDVAERRLHSTHDNSNIGHFRNDIYDEKCNLCQRIEYAKLNGLRLSKRKVNKQNLSFAVSNSSMFTPSSVTSTRSNDSNLSAPTFDFKAQAKLSVSTSTRNLVFLEEYTYYRDFGKRAEIHCGIDRCINCQCISLFWIYRVMFRIIDISARTALLLLIWILMGGFSITVVLIIEFTFFLKVVKLDNLLSKMHDHTRNIYTRVQVFKLFLQL